MALDIDTSWRQYICRACGLIYDEAEGDPDSGLAPGTRFEDIPEDWECPLCGVTKSDFEPFEAPVAAVAANAVVISREPGIVIIGAGIAGWAAAQALRAMDEKVAITLISACSGDRYHKPELSVAISRGLDVDTLVQETAEDASQRLGIKLMPLTFAVGINADTRQLRTTRGTLQYTELIIALGARPFLPAVLAESDYWHMNHISQWAELSKALGESAQRVAIVGAGMIGCELAEDLGRAGHQVTLINDQALPLASLLPAAAAQHLVNAFSALGVEYRGDANITTTQKNPSGGYQLEFDDGTALEYDQLIVATGLVTDTRLADRAGLAFNRGIVVDANNLQTSDSHIYALGDCVSFGGMPCRFIEPILSQAHAIASHILQTEQASYQHSPPVIRLKTRSLPIVIRGVPATDREWHTVSRNSQALVMEQRVDQRAVVSLTLDLSKQGRVA